MFPVTSRYNGIEVVKISLADGREVADSQVPALARLWRVR